jgi:hypothetical protein
LFGVLEISVIENPKEDERFFWKECYQKWFKVSVFIDNQRFLGQSKFWAVSH